MDEERMRALSLPLDIKPFRLRAREGWDSFLEGEGDLRALMDRKDRGDVSEELVERCSQLLSPAFSAPAFELGYHGEKYELILSPEGDRCRMFQLVYFQRLAPKQLLDRWNIIVGRTRSRQFALGMFGQEVTLEDVRVWAEKTEDCGLGLRLYCEKLGSQPEEERHYILYTLLDQALGELAAMRYVDYLDVLEAPAEGESIPLSALADFVAAEVDPEGWPQANDPEMAGERYTAYRGEPCQEEDWELRRDVYAGVTCCVPLLKGYLQGDDYYMDRLHRDGVVPGFFYYPLEGVAEILDLRDKIEQTILGRCGEGIVTFTGGATGTTLGYLDFIAWDLKTLLDTAVEVFQEVPVAWAAFHTFRRGASGIGLKAEEES